MSLKVRYLAVGALLGLVLSVAPSCGNSGGKPLCKPSNCAGCCDKNGECQLGTETFACGARADLCKECGSTQSCVDTKCVGSAGAGGGTGGVGGGKGGAGGAGGAGGGTSACGSCAGCCSADGFCRGGITNQQCGKGGQSCISCTAGLACQSGACAAVTCTTGCKDSAGACLGGMDNGACGVSGASCTACAAGLICSNGACAAPCNATTCASGCCDGNTCIQQPTAAKCGINGGACSVCSGTQVCAGGLCQAGGTGGGSGGVGGGSGGVGGGGGSSSGCSVLNCLDGCCNGNTCMPGTSKAACGVLAAACKSCGLFCALQNCVP